MSNTKHTPGAKGKKLIFKFWKNNRLDQEFTLNLDEIMLKFKEWQNFQLNTNKERGQAWLEYYYGGQLLRCFITDKEAVKGLESVFENEDFDAIYSEARKHFII